MAVVSMKQLLEAGVHFGHQTRRWNPKMKKYIYAERNDIHIIDLQQTVAQAEIAYKFVRDIAAAGKPVLCVGTKKQAQEAIKTEAERCGMFYINNRWLGGTLTNYKTIKTRIDRLNKINQMEKLGELDSFPKKEAIAVAEAHALNIPIVAVVDTNCDPDHVDVVIPANDDAIGAINIIASIVSGAVIEAKEGTVMTAPEDDEVTAEELDEAGASEEVQNG